MGLSVGGRFREALPPHAVPGRFPFHGRGPATLRSGRTFHQLNASSYLCLTLGPFVHARQYRLQKKHAESAGAR
jgi:hypothetical protein